MSKLTVFDFFDNDLLVEANKDRVFSDEDKVAIAIRSKERSLNEKFDFLEDISLTCNKELKEDIQKWIKTKIQLVDCIQNLNDPSVILITFSDENDATFGTFTSLDKAIHSWVFEYTRYIDIHRLNCENGIGYIDIIKDKMFKKIESVLDLISDIGIDLGSLPNVPEVDRKLYKHRIELSTPFKAYDYVHIPSSDDRFNDFIIADTNDKDVQEMMNCEETYENQMKYHIMNAYYDWIKLEIPTYVIFDGKIKCLYTQKYSCGRLADIYKYKIDEIPDKIKKQIDILKEYNKVNN